MTDRTPGEPTPQDFHEVAQRSQDAGIADESAGYLNGTDTPDLVDAPAATDVIDGSPGQQATPPRDDTPDASDSIEPFHIPGSAEDIKVAGVTGPGPSG